MEVSRPLRMNYNGINYKTPAKDPNIKDEKVAEKAEAYI